MSALSARVAEALPAVASLTVYRLSPSLQTFVKVSAAALETFPDVTVERIDDGETIGAAIAAIVASEPEPSQNEIDARYGLVFADAAGERVLSVYKGAFASRGQIDAEACGYNEPELHHWLAARYER